jgi:hypothetical protein
MNRILSVSLSFIYLFLFIYVLPVFAQVDSSWTDIYDGPAHGEDVASSISVLDLYLFGYYIFTSLCVTGWSSGIGTDLDYATIYYDPDTGQPFWTKRYNGLGNGDDRAHAVAIDSLGDLCVTGESWGNGTGFDYATLKYNNWGDTIWVRRYNGPGNGDDKAYAIAVDTGGNVFVTGTSYDSLTGFDYLTIKYKQNGDTAWVRRYNGPGNGVDTAVAIAVDNLGNAYVSGGSRGVGYYLDYATIKYKPDGDTAWVRRYSGLDQGNAAHAIAVDDSGNVYVTGQSRNGPISSSYATIKYRSDGEIAWTSRYRGWFFSSVGSDLALDNVGNLYVTGWSDGPSGVYDYVTLKYNASDSNPIWEARYDGPDNEYDGAYGIAVDPSGNVYVTGESDKIEQTISGYKFTSDCATIKYSPAGDTLWTRRYNGWADSNDAGLDIATDTRGNVYVTGKSFGSNFDYVTIKYSSKTRVGEEAGQENIPSRFVLGQNFPNPFNPVTSIEYYLPKSTWVNLLVYNILGQRVRVLVDEHQSPGYKSVQWDGKDSQGKEVTSGIYFYRIEAGNFVQAKKMVLIR